MSENGAYFSDRLMWKCIACAHLKLHLGIMFNIHII